MKSKMMHSLLVCLVMMIGYLPPAQAVTDAELEALEKQIEQQEAEEKKKAVLEAKRKAELEKQRLEEARQIAEEKGEKSEADAKRVIEEKRKAEAEVMRKAKEEAKKKAEAERKLKDEKERNERLKSLMAEAKSAENSNDYNLAITKYNNVLNEFPNNAEAGSNIDRIKSVLENCNAIIGEWDWFNGASMVYKPDGTFVWNLFFTGGGTWKCINPEKYEFYMTHTNNSQWDGPIWVIDNGQKLKGKEPNVFGGEYMGVISNLKQEQNETFKGL